MSNFQFPISKVLLAVIVVFGVFVAGSVLAANASDLQPADNPGSKTFSEPVVINSTLNVNKAGYFPAGVHIGKTTGEGGVTYFNGTIVNASEYDILGIPVTFGDDVRIDGEIWRGTSRGTSDNQPLKISDSIIPTKNNTYSLGSSSHQFKDGYFAGAVSVGKKLTTGSTPLGGGSANLLGETTVDKGIVLKVEKSNWLPFVIYLGKRVCILESGGKDYTDYTFSNFALPIYGDGSFSNGHTTSIESDIKSLESSGGNFKVKECKDEELTEPFDLKKFDTINFGAPIKLYKSSSPPFECNSETTVDYSKGFIYYNTTAKKFYFCGWVGNGLAWQEIAWKS